MASRTVKVIILCEGIEVSDADHERAARGFGNDLKRKSIEPLDCPSLERALAETDRIRGHHAGATPWGRRT